MLRERPRSLFPLVLLSLLLSIGCKQRAQEPLRTPNSDPIQHGLFSGNPPSEALSLTLPGPAATSLVISAGLHGYTEPCGCTEDILQGGIDRLAGVARALDAQLPSSLAVSAGDTLFRFDEAQDDEAAQDRARLEALAVGLKAAGIRLMGVGPRDLSRGLATLEDFASAADLQLLSTNLQPKDDARWSPVVTQELADLRLAFFSLVDEAAIQNTPHANALTILPAQTQLEKHLASRDARNADLRVLFFHGSQEAAATLINAVHGIDFLVLSQSAASTNEAATWGTTTVLHVWTQGRELGVLRLNKPAEAEDHTRPWSNARALSSDESEALQEMIGVVEEQIASLQARLEPGQESPLLARLQERKAGYEEELRAVGTDDAVNFSPIDRQFLWDIVPLVPGLPEDQVTQAARQHFNKQLQTINLEGATLPPAAASGEAAFVGDANCASCHRAAHSQWNTTAHASAFATLVEREKHFDLECVGCHVTGYQEPGGSSLGFLDGLANVQCESCHGPGSLHAAAPTSAGKAQAILRDVREATCLSCHTPEHSPRFDYDSYLPRIIGEGHGR